MQSETEPSRVVPLPCNVCKRPARFLTPFGLKCPHHALEAAIYADTGSDDSWLPIRIREPRSSGGVSSD